MSVERIAFVTGSTGFIGEGLCRKLAESGIPVKALIRSPEKAVSLDRIQGVELVKGDVCDPDSLIQGMKGCTEVYHLASFVEPWHRDKGIHYRVNVQGSENIMQASIRNGIKKVVQTSTAGVYGPSLNGKAVTESSTRALPMRLEYDITKSKAEEVALSYMEKGLEVVIVNPTRTYGPGIISRSNSVTMLIDRYSRGKWRFMPGDGTRLGNYVYVEDVIDGHILAMQRGTSGENYLLGGETVSYNELFRTIGEVAGKQYKMLKLPARIIHFISEFEKWKANTFNIPPLITPGFARKYMYDWDNDSSKAMRELGYSPRNLAEGVTLTYQWLQDQK